MEINELLGEALHIRIPRARGFQQEHKRRLNVSRMVHVEFFLAYRQHMVHKPTIYDTFDHRKHLLLAGKNLVSQVNHRLLNHFICLVAEDLMNGETVQHLSILHRPNHIPALRNDIDQLVPCVVDGVLRNVITNMQVTVHVNIKLKQCGCVFGKNTQTLL